ncbi:unnamed protein product [Amoebophrya sp. A120]|nr:unnamed protein product [Amoebophrya sp. A120]|eukprot:GSA120T00015623001.1
MSSAGRSSCPAGELEEPNAALIPPRSVVQGTKNQVDFQPVQNYNRSSEGQVEQQPVKILAKMNTNLQAHHEDQQDRFILWNPPKSGKFTWPASHFSLYLKTFVQKKLYEEEKYKVFVFHESEEFVTIYDGYPKAKVHLLVLPKQVRELMLTPTRTKSSSSSARKEDVGGVQDQEKNGAAEQWADKGAEEALEKLKIISTVATKTELLGHSNKMNSSSSSSQTKSDSCTTNAKKQGGGPTSDLESTVRAASQHTEAATNTEKNIDFYLRLQQYIARIQRILRRLFPTKREKAEGNNTKSIVKEVTHYKHGVHAKPSLQQLHCHIISTDFVSANLKNRKHWFSFQAPFLIPIWKVLEILQGRNVAFSTLEGYIQECCVSFEANLRRKHLHCVCGQFAALTMPELKRHLEDCWKVNNRVNKWTMSVFQPPQIPDGADLNQNPFFLEREKELEKEKTEREKKRSSEREAGAQERVVATVVYNPGGAPSSPHGTGPKSGARTVDENEKENAAFSSRKTTSSLVQLPKPMPARIQPQQGRTTSVSEDDASTYLLRDYNLKKEVFVYRTKSRSRSPRRNEQGKSEKQAVDQVVEMKQNRSDPATLFNKTLSASSEVVKRSTMKVDEEDL